MSTAAYLLGSNNARPQAAFGEGPSDSEEFDFENWLLAASWRVPLMWFFLFSEKDLLDHPINAGEDAPSEPVKIPCCEMLAAAERLEGRKALINEWFGAKSKLDYHVDMFAGWLRSLPYKFITLDWYELIQAKGTPMARYSGILAAIDRRDRVMIAPIPALLAESDIDPNVPFMTLEDAECGVYSDEMQSNFFCLMGAGHNHQPAWE
jgi:hypothetical protein